MKSKQFPSMEEAKAYMMERGKLTYFGTEGWNPEKYGYTLTIGVRVYHLFMYKDGLVEVYHERYKRSDEE
jgi:hypothetical protein